jgi:hypothetical protein
VPAGIPLHLLRKRSNSETNLTVYQADFHTKSAIYSIKDDRVASLLGPKIFEEHPELVNISLQISTNRTPMGLCRIICGVYALDDKQQVIEIETNGMRKGQWTTLCVTFESSKNCENGDRAQGRVARLQGEKMQSWGNIVKFLRNVTVAKFKRTGERKDSALTEEDRLRMKELVEMERIGLDE